MTRSTQLRAVARNRQHEPPALPRIRRFLGKDEQENHRADVAGVSRDRCPDGAGLSGVCCAAAETRHVKQLEDHIRRVVDAAPPLTAEQREKLALLLRGSRVSPTYATTASTALR
jgi:hypothetical protein